MTLRGGARKSVVRGMSTTPTPDKQPDFQEKRPSPGNGTAVSLEGVKGGG